MRGESWRRSAVALGVATATALATLALGAAMAPAQDGKAKNESKKAARGKGLRKDRKGGLGVPEPPAKALGKGERAVADPLGRAGADDLPLWPYWFKFRLLAADRAPLDAVYYPSRVEFNAPVMLMVHDKAGSAREFEEPIDELKGKGIAEHFQAQGYAVLVVDFRSSPPPDPRAVRRGPAPKVWRGRPDDIQVAYRFLLDRHNRGELNLEKFGVLAVGEGANLAADWAASPGAVAANDLVLSDLAAMAFVSPLGEVAGTLKLSQSIPVIAPRVDLLLLAGESDRESFRAVKGVQPIVERRRTSQVSYAPTNLHGDRYLRFVPRATTTLVKFFDGTIRARAGAEEWEPRYNLDPVSYTDAQAITPADRQAAGADANANPKAERKAPARAPEPDAPASKKGRR
ncbi:MAG TPA: lysophospholipase [Isosphaeraceae bacterium]|jgi:hypothetical protein|nr:lysophospholipase [Isosphaeraceae bacterium]